MSGTSASYSIRVRPCLGQCHRYEIACKTTSGIWHCLIYVIIRVSYSIPNGSTGNDKL
ncbi:hypothetical protein F383_24422 [Gossypium arboreum]|uniref:Uncharacterized protein n=1 Tax=Gossypium arboreum TaxID=29729 RepID=A0A0B0P6K2_GOSAR|nr:hypothetical protein F383_24422 [Gossypium arboreum]